MTSDTCRCGDGNSEPSPWSMTLVANHLRCFAKGRVCHPPGMHQMHGVWSQMCFFTAPTSLITHGSSSPMQTVMIESRRNVFTRVPNARREEKHTKRRKKLERNNWKVETHPRRQAKTRSQSRRLFDTCTRALVHSSVCLFVDWRGRCECDNGSACSQVVPLQQNHEHGNHGHMLREVQTLSSQHFQKPHVSTRRILRFFVSEPSTCWSMWSKSRTICFCLDHTVPLPLNSPLWYI